MRCLILLLILAGGASTNMAQQSKSAPPSPLTLSTKDYLYRSWKKLSIAQGRDLTIYDQEVSQCCWRLDSTVKARAFLWQHWREKRRTYLIVTFIGLDSVDKAHIFVEPDEHGEWHVIWRRESIIPPRRGSIVDDMPDIRSIELRSVDERDYRYKGGHCILFFIGKDGKEVETL